MKVEELSKQKQEKSDKIAMEHKESLDTHESNMDHIQEFLKEMGYHG